MNATSLMLSMLFGTVGLGYLMYAKNAGRFAPAIAGVALMVVPYFISSVLVMVIACLALVAMPFVLREL